MKETWGLARDEWVKTTSIAEDTSLWAIDCLNKNENAIYEIERIAKEGSKNEFDSKLKELKKLIKSEIIKKETNLDNLSLTSANSAKLQVSVPSSLNYLMKAWAAAEGRDLSSVALQCLEIGLRTMKSKGSIPPSAIERYNDACKKRIALAEVNNLWDQFESINIHSGAK